MTLRRNQSDEKINYTVNGDGSRVRGSPKTIHHSVRKRKDHREGCVGSEHHLVVNDVQLATCHGGHRYDCQRKPKGIRIIR